MIIIPQSDNMIRIVFQPDHARHAAQMIQHWQRPCILPKALWERLITATKHHDDGWHRHKYQPLISDDGCPYSFLSLPVRTHIKYLKYCIESLIKEDRYQAVLVLLHFKYIFSETKSDIKDQCLVDHYLSWTDQQIDLSIARLRDEEPSEYQEGFTRPNLRLAQRIMTFADRLSLMLIGALPWNRFEGSVSYDINDVPLRYKPDEWGVRLDPWPFMDPFFSVNVNARSLSEQHYETSEEFFDVLGAAPTYRITHRMMPYE
ncbi:hypothetical protein KS4_32120 [Poriferisphaera corsica]|uniref:DUF3891 family protein n=1 Tax=Poriferisphaera corsica TaxID=2528020 RepID=A0A517YY17_9BACT|nr:DUF3891 family protein [Poriferisphaera corsica]QDU35132.1 hypothetical protein KS4_32120 [Poriferisphaera corsica]